MPHIKPPAPLPTLPCRSIFLAGSIEMGQCKEWQQSMADTFHRHDPSIMVFNPRRDSWDSSWRQDIENQEFRRQVEWELDGINDASVVAFYFDPDTRAPISLLELGLIAGTRPARALVCCPPGYWRRGNVQIICARHGIPLFETIDQLTQACLDKINEII